MGRKVLAVGKIVQRYVVQQLVKRGKSRFVNYVTQEYGQLAGGAAGIALSVSVGDYYGALTGITGNFGNNPPDRRNPPFGYLEGDAPVNGPTNGSFNQALRPVQSGKYYRRSKARFKRRKCCPCKPKRSSQRSRRRMYY